MTETARRLQAGHCLCNVTPLVEELLDLDSELAFELMYGDPESSQLAYPADQVWVVSDWLAGQLRKQEERVLRRCELNLWARRGNGPAVHLDDVFLRIAKAYKS